MNRTAMDFSRTSSMVLAALLVLAWLPARSAAPTAEHLRWWREGRLGIFIHWGPVSLKGTEISWSRANSNTNCPNQGAIPVDVYDNLFREFDPARFDADRWASIIRRAGAKYFVLTAKHCDGFLLWHSQASDYNISRTPFRRDICAELSAAARRAGLRVGWYFSPMDWRDPDFRTERNPIFLERMRAELRELLGSYGTTDLLWFDWDGREAVYDQAATYRLVRELQPRMVINNRLDLGPKSSDREILSTNADYYTPEQTVGAYDDQRPWESCMTLSRKNQWAWGGADDGVKSERACLEMLVRCAGGDGNLLLNVGPMPNGEIAPEQVERLEQLGAWLAKHGESIYGTRGGPFKPGTYGASTRRGRKIYVHLLDRSLDPLELPPIAAKIVSSRVLGGGEAEVRQTGTGITVHVGEAERRPIDTVVALELDQSALDLPALEVTSVKSLAVGAKVTASNVFQGQAEFAADRATDGKDDTRWATDGGTATAWLEIDFGRPVTFRRVRIAEAFAPRVRKFELQAWSGERWQTFFTGTEIAEAWSRTFPAVSAQRVRLNILDASEGPSLWSFDVFP